MTTMRWRRKTDRLPVTLIESELVIVFDRLRAAERRLDRIERAISSHFESKPHSYMEMEPFDSDPLRAQS